MDSSDQSYSVGYKRPPKPSQFKKGQSGNPGGRRRKVGPVRVDVDAILNETFSVSVAGRTQTMSAKEIEIRQILKRALEKKDFRSIAYLIELFQKHGSVATEPKSGVLTLPTNTIPSRMCDLLFAKHGHPDGWTKRQIAWARKIFEATKTEFEALCEAAGVVP